MTSTGTQQAARPVRTAARLLRAQPDRLLVPAIVLTVAGLLGNVALQWLIGEAVGSTACDRHYLGATLVARCADENGRAQLGTLAGLYVLFVIGHLIAAGLSRAALDLLDEAPSRGVFGGWSVLRALPAALSISALLTIATVFLVLPGVLAAFLTRYAMVFVVDRGLGGVAAVRASVGLVVANLRGELGFAALSVLVLLAGLLALVLGLFVALPLVLLAQTVRYRSLAPG